MWGKLSGHRESHREEPHQHTRERLCCCSELCVSSHKLARPTWETTKGSCDAAGRDAAFWHVALWVRAKSMYFGSEKRLMGYSLWRPLAIFFIQGYQINDIPNSNRGYSTCLTILPQGSTGSQGQAAHLKWQHEVVEQEKMFCLLISVGDLAPNLFVFPCTAVIIYGLFSSSVLRSHLNPEWDVSNLCISNLESDFTYCCRYWLGCGFCHYFCLVSCCLIWWCRRIFCHQSWSRIIWAAKTWIPVELW